MVEQQKQEPLEAVDGGGGGSAHRTGVRIIIVLIIRTCIGELEGTHKGRKIEMPIGSPRGMNR